MGTKAGLTTIDNGSVMKRCSGPRVHIPVGQAVWVDLVDGLRVSGNRQSHHQQGHEGLTRKIIHARRIELDDISREEMTMSGVGLARG